jgi:hypothetical protein
VILIYLPFAVWDVAGLRNNLLFPFFRWTDSTALADSLSPAAQRALTIAGAIVVVGMLGRAWKSKWHPRSAAEYVLLAGLTALATGKVFHNNYLV